MSNCLIIGCGYVGSQVASIWQRQSRRVFAVTRNSEKAEQLRREGMEPIVVNWMDLDRVAQLFQSMPSIERVLIAVSHAPIDGVASELTHIAGLRNVVPRINGLRRLVYISTTGVYEHREDGGWVTEDSTVMPTRPGSIAAVNAERWLLENVATNKLSILRAAGIYGPNRIPRLDSLRKGEPISIDPESYLNLIHLDDLAEICAVMSDHEASHTIYNVCDGKPTLRKDYYDFICEKIGAPPPTFVPKLLTNETSAIRTRGEGSKRISNDRLVNDTHYAFHFEDFRKGLSPLL